MKRVLYALLLTSFGLMGYGQHYLTCYLDTLGAGLNNSTITFTANCGNYNCGASMNMRQEIVSYDLPEGWSLNIFTPSQSLDTGVMSTEYYMPILNRVDVGFEVHTNEVDGIGYVSVKFTNLKNPQDCEIFTLKARAPGGTLGGIELSYEQTPLLQNAPNPFFSSTAVHYSLNESEGRLLITDLSGRVVEDHYLNSVQSEIEVGMNLNPGTYFYTLYDGNQAVATERMIKSGN